MVTVFLDIDGVLNQLQYGYYLDKKCIDVFKEIFRGIDYQIVLTSSWRLGFSHTYKRCSPQIKRLLGYIDVYSRTKRLGSRSEEVLDYIKSHNTTNYIIIDDDISEFSFRLPNTYIVSSKTGLVKSDIKKVRRLICT